MNTATFVTLSRAPRSFLPQMTVEQVWVWWSLDWGHDGSCAGGGAAGGDAGVRPPSPNYAGSDPHFRPDFCDHDRYAS